MDHVRDVLVVTFVCTANICRSAYAEVRAKQLLADLPGRLRVLSAGTWGFTDEPMCADMAAQARAQGLDPEGFRSQRLTRQLVHDSDLLLTAETEHRSFLLEEWPGAFKKVFTVSQFADAIAHAPASVTGTALISYAKKHKKAPDPEGNIADPYNRGADAAHRCAAHLDALLTAIVPRLAG